MNRSDAGCARRAEAYCQLAGRTMQTRLDGTTIRQHMAATAQTSRTALPLPRHHHIRVDLVLQLYRRTDSCASDRCQGRSPGAPSSGSTQSHLLRSVVTTTMMARCKSRVSIHARTVDVRGKKVRCVTVSALIHRKRRKADEAARTMLCRNEHIACSAVQPSKSAEVRRRCRIEVDAVQQVGRCAIRLHGVRKSFICLLAASTIELHCHAEKRGSDSGNGNLQNRRGFWWIDRLGLACLCFWSGCKDKAKQRDMDGKGGTRGRERGLSIAFLLNKDLRDPQAKRRRLDLTLQRPTLLARRERGGFSATEPGP